MPRSNGHECHALRLPCSSRFSVPRSIHRSTGSSTLSTCSLTYNMVGHGLRGAPAQVFVDDCLVLLSAVPMHLRWEEILIAFSNTLPFEDPLGGMYCDASFFVC